MALPYPIIFVPGITASCLRDMYPLPAENIWTVLKKRYNRVALHPNNLQYEFRQPAIVRPDQIFEIAYEELIEELREELEDHAGKEVPVFPFSYDWRQPMEVTQQVLADFIQEVIDRTKLLPHYHKTYGSELKVNLVGHSMGGLVISRCLTDQARQLPINKVSTLAAPFRGSFESIVQLTIGTGNLGSGKPSHAERHAARVTPSLYQLLPAFSNGVNIDPAFPQTFFDAAAWQPTVVDSLAKYIKKSGIPSDDFRADAATLFDNLLSGAQLNADKLANLNLSDHGLNNKDWLAIVGVDCDTRVQQNVEVLRGSPSYVFDHNVDVVNEWQWDDTGSDWRRTGDGTVPFEGAVPPFLSENELVLITPEDYGFWELADKGLTKIGGFHGILPNMNLIQRLLLRFFTGKGDKHRNTWGRAVPGVTDWQPPLPLQRRRS